MGKVAKQSLWNSLNAYLGVALGAFNSIYLFPRVFLNEPDFYGEINTLLAAATLVSSFGHLGLPVSLLTYLPKFTDKQKESFWTFSLAVSLACSLVLMLGAFIIYQFDPHWMGSVGYLLLVSLSMLLFEVFASLSQNYSRVIFPQFLKNTFRRMIILVALIMVAYGGGEKEFYWVLGGGYLLQLLAVILYSVKDMPKLNFDWSDLPQGEIFKYGGLVMLASASILVVSKIDILMISSMLGNGPVAFYSIAFFIGSVVSVPVKSLIVSIRPFITKAWVRNDIAEVDRIYKKSALTQLSLTGFLFLLIWSNLDLAFLVLPQEYRFDGAASIVFCIGLSEVVKGATGTNGMILTISNKQVYNFYSGLVLIALTVLGNWIMIPAWGIFGAALASLVALSLFDVYKIILVKHFYGLIPFSRDFWLIAVSLAACLLAIQVLQEFMPTLISKLVVGNLCALILFWILFRYTKALDDFKIFRLRKG